MLRILCFVSVVALLKSVCASGAEPADRGLLDEVQFRAWRFFEERADEKTGLVSDRGPNRDGEDFPVASIAATGYGFAALPVAVERGWLARDEAVRRAERTLGFLAAMPHERGWFYHFVDKRSGERVWNCEVSSIDTALLFAGIVVCAEYFRDDHPEIARAAGELHGRIDWRWMMTNGGAHPEKRVLSHGWTPEHGFIPYDYGAYSEAILMVLLGMGATAEPLPEDAWDALTREVTRAGDHEALVGGPIFIEQMPAGFFDFRGRRDRLGWDYWQSSRNALEIHRGYCVENPNDRKTFAGGFWGSTRATVPMATGPTRSAPMRKTARFRRRVCSLRCLSHRRSWKRRRAGCS